MQSKRRGRHLYTSCPSCGLDQRTGAEVQNRIWHSMEWRAGVDRMHHRPSSVRDGWVPKEEHRKEPELGPKLGEDWSPVTEEETESPQPEAKLVGSNRAMVAVAAAVAAVAIILRAA